MAFDRNINDLKILFVLLISFPLISSTNIDCGGKSFHCLNSTHFMICVDLGGGASYTVDDFVIPCPKPTTCAPTNRFECEFPLSTTLAPTTIYPAAVTTGIETTTEDVIVDTITMNTGPEQHLELSTMTQPPTTVIPLRPAVTTLNETYLIETTTDYSAVNIETLTTVFDQSTIDINSTPVSDGVINSLAPINNESVATKENLITSQILPNANDSLDYNLTENLIEVFTTTEFTSIDNNFNVANETSFVGSDVIIGTNVTVQQDEIATSTTVNLISVTNEAVPDTKTSLSERDVSTTDATMAVSDTKNNYTSTPGISIVTTTEIVPNFSTVKTIKDNAAVTEQVLTVSEDITTISPNTVTTIIGATENKDKTKIYTRSESLAATSTNSNIVFTSRIPPETTTPTAIYLTNDTITTERAVVIDSDFVNRTDNYLTTTELNVVATKEIGSNSSNVKTKEDYATVTEQVQIFDEDITTFIPNIITLVTATENTDTTLVEKGTESVVADITKNDIVLTSNSPPEITTAQAIYSTDNIIISESSGVIDSGYVNETDNYATTSEPNILATTNITPTLSVVKAKDGSVTITEQAQIVSEDITTLTPNNITTIVTATQNTGKTLVDKGSESIVANRTKSDIVLTSNRPQEITTVKAMDSTDNTIMSESTGVIDSDFENGTDNYAITTKINILTTTKLDQTVPVLKAEVDNATFTEQALFVSEDIITLTPNNITTIVTATQNTGTTLVDKETESIVANRNKSDIVLTSNRPQEITTVRAMDSTDNTIMSESASVIDSGFVNGTDNYAITTEINILTIKNNQTVPVLKAVVDNTTVTEQALFVSEDITTLTPNNITTIVTATQNTGTTLVDKETESIVANRNKSDIVLTSNRPQEITTVRAMDSTGNTIMSESTGVIDSGFVNGTDSYAITTEINIPTTTKIYQTVPVLKAEVDNATVTEQALFVSEDIITLTPNNITIIVTATQNTGTTLVDKETESIVANRNKSDIVLTSNRPQEITTVRAMDSTDNTIMSESANVIDSGFVNGTDNYAITTEINILTTKNNQTVPVLKAVVDNTTVTEQALFVSEDITTFTPNNITTIVTATQNTGTTLVDKETESIVANRNKSDIVLTSNRPQEITTVRAMDSTGNTIMSESTGVIDSGFVNGTDSYAITTEINIPTTTKIYQTVPVLKAEVDNATVTEQALFVSEDIITLTPNNITTIVTATQNTGTTLVDKETESIVANRNKSDIVLTSNSPPEITTARAIYSTDNTIISEGAGVTDSNFVNGTDNYAITTELNILKTTKMSPTLPAVKNKEDHAIVTEQIQTVTEDATGIPYIATTIVSATENTDITLVESGTESIVAKSTKSGINVDNVLTSKTPAEIITAKAVYSTDKITTEGADIINSSLVNRTLFQGKTDNYTATTELNTVITSGIGPTLPIVKIKEDNAYVTEKVQIVADNMTTIIPNIVTTVDSATENTDKMLVHTGTELSVNRTNSYIVLMSKLPPEVTTPRAKYSTNKTTTTEGASVNNLNFVNKTNDLSTVTTKDIEPTSSIFKTKEDNATVTDQVQIDAENMITFIPNIVTSIVNATNNIDTAANNRANSDIVLTSKNPPKITTTKAINSTEKTITTDKTSSTEGLGVIDSGFANKSDFGNNNETIITKIHQATTGSSGNFSADSINGVLAKPKQINNVASNVIYEVNNFRIPSAANKINITPTELHSSDTITATTILNDVYTYSTNVDVGTTLSTINIKLSNFESNGISKPNPSVNIEGPSNMEDNISTTRINLSEKNTTTNDLPFMTVLPIIDTVNTTEFSSVIGENMLVTKPIANAAPIDKVSQHFATTEHYEKNADMIDTLTINEFVTPTQHEQFVQVLRDEKPQASDITTGFATTTARTKIEKYIGNIPLTLTESYELKESTLNLTKTRPDNETTLSPALKESFVSEATNLSLDIKSNGSDTEDVLTTSSTKFKDSNCTSGYSTESALKIDSPNKLSAETNLFEVQETLKPMDILEINNIIIKIMDLPTYETNTSLPNGNSKLADINLDSVVSTKDPVNVNDVNKISSGKVLHYASTEMPLLAPLLIDDDILLQNIMQGNLNDLSQEKEGTLNFPQKVQDKEHVKNTSVDSTTEAIVSVNNNVIQQQEEFTPTNSLTLATNNKQGTIFNVLDKMLLNTNDTASRRTEQVTLSQNNTNPLQNVFLNGTEKNRLPAIYTSAINTTELGEINVFDSIQNNETGNWNQIDASNLAPNIKDNSIRSLLNTVVPGSEQNYFEQINTVKKNVHNIGLKRNGSLPNWPQSSGSNIVGKTATTTNLEETITGDAVETIGIEQTGSVFNSTTSTIKKVQETGSVAYSEQSTVMIAVQNRGVEQTGSVTNSEHSATTSTVQNGQGRTSPITSMKKGTIMNAAQNGAVEQTGSTTTYSVQSITTRSVQLGESRLSGSVDNLVQSTITHETQNGGMKRTGSVANSEQNDATNTVQNGKKNTGLVANNSEQIGSTNVQNVEAQNIGSSDKTQKQNNDKDANKKKDSFTYSFDTQKSDLRPSHAAGNSEEDKHTLSNFELTQNVSRINLETNNATAVIQNVTLNEDSFISTEKNNLKENVNFTSRRVLKIENGIVTLSPEHTISTTLLKVINTTSNDANEISSNTPTPALLITTSAINENTASVNEKLGDIMKNIADTTLNNDQTTTPEKAYFDGASEITKKLSSRPIGFAENNLPMVTLSESAYTSTPTIFLQTDENSTFTTMKITVVEPSSVSDVGVTLSTASDILPLDTSQPPINKINIVETETANSNIMKNLSDGGQQNSNPTFVNNNILQISTTTQSSTLSPIYTKATNLLVTEDKAVETIEKTRHVPSVVTTSESATVAPITVAGGPENVPIILEYDCQNRPSGKYAINNDCSKFYICNGTPKPIVGSCPVNSVFSEIRKQCTRNLSHCIRNNEFKCSMPGRYADYLKPNAYYICIRKDQKFLRYKLQCQDGFLLNRMTVRCYKNTQATSQPSSDNSLKTTESVLSPDNELVNVSTSLNKNSFECDEEGRFADSNDCRGYYICKLKNISDETYRKKYKRCDSDEVFHKEKKKCVDASSYECRYCDGLKSNVYYVRVKRLQHYYTFKLQCQTGYYLSTNHVKCVRVEELTSQSESSDNSRSKNDQISQEEKEFKRNKNRSFECEDEGMYADPNDCRKYYICKENESSEQKFRRKHKKCGRREVFNKHTQECVYSRNYKCL